MYEDEMPPYPEERDQDLIDKYRVPLDESMDAFICVTGAPKAPQNMLGRLTTVLTAVVQTFGRMKPNSIHLPTDAQGGSKGYFFVEFEDAHEAERACKAANGYRLDKNHVFGAYSFGDIFKYSDVPDEWVPPPKPEFRERENFRFWLSDPDARDQFSTLHGAETSIFWHMKSDPHQLIRSRPSWTESHLQWSPQGSYLATFHPKGVALWGGPEWTKIVRFFHLNVRQIEFSPNENFLVTWSSAPFEASGGAPANIVVWEVRTGKLLRSFNIPGNAWPVLKWSHDDRYVAALSKDAISIYETPSMALLDKKSIIAAGVQDFSWSPKQNILAYWTPEADNNPARVTLIEIPSRNITRTKNLFNVQDCKFYWQSAGDYLIVNVTRLKGKKPFTNLEIFRMKEKGIPVEVLEFPEDNFPLVSWEPRGETFILGNGGEGTTTTLSFYVIEKTVKLLKTLEKKQINRIFWSPRGQFVILAYLGAPLNGTFEFWNAKDLESMAQTEHYLASEVEWDPTGRYVCTTVSAWKVSADTGFKIWDFKGTLVSEQNVDRFFQFLWRPRPPTLLSKDKLKEIKKNLSKYSSIFNKEDEEKDTSATAAAKVARRKLFENWKAFMETVNDQYQKQRRLREELRGYASDNEDEVTVIEEYEEEVIEEIRTPVS